MTIDVRAPSGVISLSIRYDQGREAWAQWVAESAARFVVAAERWTGVPFRSRKLRVEGSDEVWFDPPTGAPVRVGGVNDGRAVKVEYGLAAIGEPWLLFHELGHFWFDYDWSHARDGFWFIEGLVSNMAQAMAESGELSLAPSERDSIRAAWGGPDYALQKYDYPLIEDRRYAAQPPGPVDRPWYSVFYTKSYKAVYYIRALAGPERFRAACRESASTLAHRAGNAEVLAMLERAAPAVDWKARLSGWVLPGAYAGPGYADFADPDRDGLASIDESLGGTDPRAADSDGDLLPDGFERSYGSDPLRAAARADAEALVRDNGPWPDGDPSEWRACSSIERAEREGDGETWDMLRCALSVSGDSLVVAVFGPRGTGLAAAFPAESPRSAQAFADLLVDADGDGDRDQELAAFVLRPDEAWRYDVASASSRSPGAGKVGVGACLEFALPLASLPPRFRVLPILRDMEAGRNLAEWDHWIEVDLAAYRAYRAKGLSGNPWADDRDADGIPDMAELASGLDPLVPAPLESLRASGPFVDGSPLDWRAFSDPSPIRCAEYPDASGDSRSIDLLRIRALVKAGILYVCADYRAAGPVPKRAMFDVVIDANGDGMADYDFAFELSAPERPWRYDSAKGASDNPSPLLAAAPASYRAGPSLAPIEPCFEIAIPLSLVPGSGPIRIYPIAYDLDAKTTLDGPDSGWITVERN
jgi:hypothetical protein